MVWVLGRTDAKLETILSVLDRPSLVIDDELGIPVIGHTDTIQSSVKVREDRQRQRAHQALKIWSGGEDWTRDGQRSHKLEPRPEAPCLVSNVAEHNQHGRTTWNPTS